MKNDVTPLLNTLQSVYRHLQNESLRARKKIAAVHPRQKKSAANLIHYLALRSENLRPLQDSLHAAGLSSLASSESHVLRQVQEVLERLGWKIPKEELSALDAAAGAELLQQRAMSLFGQKTDPIVPFLMVTFESALADDLSAVKNLLKAGMNIARINCAHDDPEKWKRMIKNIHKAVQITGIPCKIYLDLAGPKVRTTLLAKGRLKGSLKLKEHSTFLLAETGAEFGKKEKVVGCTLPGIVKDLRTGDRVLFDDGLFEAEVDIPREQIATMRMIRVSAAKPRLKPEKGMNFPNTPLSVRCLTDYDKSILPFAAAHGDLLGFSFVRSAEDIAELQALQRRTGGKKLPLILKIETFEAVQNLPALLLQGMAEPLFGVMIARGDLAVEIGFERLSEIQEEILWLCEAAHVPVIWATQVLESLNKSGIATRSEITDAARSSQAECVMLNKGKNLITVMATLKNILHRSGEHHAKKRYIFRPLKIAERFFNSY